MTHPKCYQSPTAQIYWSYFLFPSGTYPLNVSDKAGLHSTHMLCMFLFVNYFPFCKAGFRFMMTCVCWHWLPVLPASVHRDQAGSEPEWGKGCVHVGLCRGGEPLPSPTRHAALRIAFFFLMVVKLVKVSDGALFWFNFLCRRKHPALIHAVPVWCFRSEGHCLLFLPGHGKDMLSASRVFRARVWSLSPAWPCLSCQWVTKCAH